MQLFVDNLTNVDFSYLDADRGLVGETWLASIELEGHLDNQGMICDFGIVKKKLPQWLDTHIDHCLLVPTQNDHAQIEQHENTTVEWRGGSGHIRISAPPAAITQMTITTCDKRSVAAWCETQLRALFPDTISHLSLSFHEEAIPGPFYHYSHGLKKHDGACQRIAHGHRSKIEIWKNGHLDLPLMAQWATLFKDIYIGTQADIVDESDSHWQFAYQAIEGAFEMQIPKTHCYLINTDSTVELIAHHIANTLKQDDKESTFIVKAFEGNGKDAKITV